MTDETSEEVEPETDELPEDEPSLDTLLAEIDELHEELADVREQPYSPAQVSAWNGQPPATLGEALDRIAKKLGPIPA